MTRKRAVIALPVFIVAVGAWIISYLHIYELTLEHGQNASRPGCTP